MILVIGSLALDSIETPFGKKQKILGGSASHFAVAASLMAPVEIVGVVGKDFPRKYINYFQKKKIDVSGIEFSQEPTFQWKGYYDRQMDIAHTEKTELGAFASFNPTLTKKQRNSKFLFLANIDPEIQSKVFDQVEDPTFVGLDSMNYWIESKSTALRKVVQKVNTLFLNDSEVRQFTQESSLIKAARKIQKKGPRMLVVKLGEYGVLVVSQKFIFSSSAYPTEKVKDPTGAGDSFAGGFVSFIYSKTILDKGSLEDEEIIKQAIIWGSSVASFSVEDFSTKGLNRINKKNILKRCREIHKITNFSRHG